MRLPRGRLLPWVIVLFSGPFVTDLSVSFLRPNWKLHFRKLLVWRFLDEIGKRFDVWETATCSASFSTWYSVWERLSRRWWDVRVHCSSRSELWYGFNSWPYLKLSLFSDRDHLLDQFHVFRCQRVIACRLCSFCFRTTLTVSSSAEVGWLLLVLRQYL